MNPGEILSPVCRGKQVSDALESLLWANDRTIADGRVRRYRVPKGEERLEVRAWILPADAPPENIPKGKA